MKRDRLLISFSGGRTSAFMARWIQENCTDVKEQIVMFANTGQEDEATLEFVNECDKRWNLGVVWVEAVVHPKARVGTTHRVVTFETATRDGSIFEAMIAKYGIPNKNFPHCTRELKLRPLKSYLRSIGWETGSYTTAIGIRADEGDRMDPNFEKNGFWYPLISLGATKDSILQWWFKQPFDLGLKEHRGNCVWCWKKSLRKLMTLAKETPEVFDFPARMEREYANAGSGEGARVFFRQGKSTQEILELAKRPFVPFVEAQVQIEAFSDLDVSQGCSESCEVFGEGA